MQAQLRVPYRDTAADDLVWLLGEPPFPSLAMLELAVPGGQIQLRLLGSSHQVIFTAGATVISEVVACADTSAANRNRLRFDGAIRSRTQPVAVPAAAARALPGWDYRFRSSTHRLEPDRFGERIDRLMARLRDHPAAIVGQFPGSPHAVTALLAGPLVTCDGGAGVRWRTWHAYPQDGGLVATSTAVWPR